MLYCVLNNFSFRDREQSQGVVGGVLSTFIPALLSGEYSIQRGTGDGRFRASPAVCTKALGRLRVVIKADCES